MHDDDPTVFSSGPEGSSSSRKGKADRSKTTPPPVAKTDGIVRVRRETAGRGGKTVTTIAGVPGSADDLRALAVDLKRACGSGGTIKYSSAPAARGTSGKEGVIEIQGDHRERIVTLLEARGLKVKLAGG